MAVPQKAISQKNSTGQGSGLIFEGLHYGSPSRILSLRSSQSCLKPSKITLPPQNAIDIALPPARRAYAPEGGEWPSLA